MPEIPTLCLSIPFELLPFIGFETITQKFILILHSSYVFWTQWSPTGKEQMVFQVIHPSLTCSFSNMRLCVTKWPPDADCTVSHFRFEGRWWQICIAVLGLVGFVWALMHTCYLVLESVKSFMPRLAQKCQIDFSPHWGSLGQDVQVEGCSTGN